jgi:hypothetical protein
LSLALPYLIYDVQEQVSEIFEVKKVSSLPKYNSLKTLSMHTLKILGLRS